jgi:hypothetical protein
MHLYEVEVVVGKQKTARRKIVGGFSLTAEAKVALREHGISIQQYLKGVAYRPDYVWTMASRSLAKVGFTACYLVLTVSGTVALACAGIVVAATQLR